MSNIVLEYIDNWDFFKMKNTICYEAIEERQNEFADYALEIWKCQNS